MLAHIFFLFLTGKGRQVRKATFDIFAPANLRLVFSVFNTLDELQNWANNIRDNVHHVRKQVFGDEKSIRYLNLILLNWANHIRDDVYHVRK